MHKIGHWWCDNGLGCVCSIQDPYIYPRRRRQMDPYPQGSYAEPTVQGAVHSSYYTRRTSNFDQVISDKQQGGRVVTTAFLGGPVLLLDNHCASLPPPGHAHVPALPRSSSRPRPASRRAARGQALHT